MVDVMVRAEDVYLLAQEDDWRPGAAAVALSRPSFWAWNENALNLLRTLYTKARNAAPETLSEWQLAGMHGAARAVSPATLAYRTQPVVSCGQRRW
jgi:hypothetical protein